MIKSESKYKKKIYYDLRLNDYLYKVYKYMFISFLFTIIISLLISSSQKITYIIHYTPIKILVSFIPFIVTFNLNYFFMRMSKIQTKLYLVFFSFFMALPISSIFLLLYHSSVMRILFIVIITFIIISFYSIYNKRNFLSIGYIINATIVGLFIASFMNVILKSSIIHFISTTVGMIVFIFLILHDTQKIKELYYKQNAIYLLVIYGSLIIYMNFLNFFISFLQLFGVKKK